MAADECKQSAPVKQEVDELPLKETECVSSPDLFSLEVILNAVNTPILADTPELPTQSSTEILAELFQSFNAEPPEIAPVVESEHFEEEVVVLPIKISKKSKKKHKHKVKKHKRKEKGKKRSSSNNGDKDLEIVLNSDSRKRKHKHSSERKKRRHRDVSVSKVSKDKSTKVSKDHSVKVAKNDRVKVIAKDNSAKVASKDNCANVVSKDNCAKVVSNDNCSKVVSKDSSTKVVSKNNSAKVVSKDNSAKVVSKDNSADFVSKDNSAKVVSKDNSADFVSKDSSSNAVIKDSSFKAVIKDSSSKVITRDSIAKVTVKENSVKPFAKEDSSKVLKHRSAKVVAKDSSSNIVEVKKEPFKPAGDQVSIKVTTDASNKVKRTVEYIPCPPVIELPETIKEEVKSEEKLTLVPLVEKVEKEEASVFLSVIPKPEKLDTTEVIPEEQSKPVVQSGILTKEKGKLTTGKIVIKNLKFSSVFEETVRQVEEEAKLKAEKYEEGEISDSSAVPTSSEHSQEEDLSQEEPITLSPITLSPVTLSPIVEEIKFEPKAPSPEKVKQYRTQSGEEEDKKISHKSHGHKRKIKSKSRSRSRDKHSHKRSGSKGKVHSKRKRSRSKEKDTDKVKEKERNRTHHSRRSRSKEHDNKPERARDRKRTHRSRSRTHRSGDRIKRARTRSRSRRRSRSNSDGRIDKPKLLEIARKNAMALLKQGVLPSSVVSTQDKVVAIKAGGKSVEELTDFCKQLSKKEAMGHDSSDSDLEDRHHSTDSETERPFHHPFQIKERPSSIVLNIRNSVQLPVKTLQEKTAEQSKILRIQFPVSSGQQHRKTENEWVPVSPKKEEPVLAKIAAEVKAVPDPVPKGEVFPAVTGLEDLDIGSIVSQRLTAMRKLQENPNDVQAITEMHRAQKDMQMWAESKQQPGQFTGSTGVRVLSAAELSSGFQAWAKKDQLKEAIPLSSGMGMTLLQKMGWRPGEGLGKNKEGSLEPLQLEVKMDKKGLVSQEEKRRVFPPPLNQPPPQLPPPPPVTKTLSGKHPVSLLVEYCSKRRWGAPQFDICFECGPDHKKNFLFKVRVNGIEYKPSVASPNKKQGKAEAASICLQSLGVLPP